MKELSLKDIRVEALNLIEASAGTGKTWTIAALYIRLLLEKNLSPEDILVVTYTRAATAELKDRIRRRIISSLKLFTGDHTPEDDLEEMLLENSPDRSQAVKILTRALFSFDDASIFTIHGFCQRALTENAFESASLFDTEMITDQSALIQNIADDFWRSGILADSESFVSQLVSARQTPSTLLKPFAGHFQNRSLQIIPATDDPDFNVLTSRRDNLFQKALLLWRSSREEIVALLKEPGLNQQSYKPLQVDNAVDLMEDWFLSNRPSPGCEKIILFSTLNLEKKTTKGGTPPKHAFFDLVQELLKQCDDTDLAFKQKIMHRQAAFHAWLQDELPRRKAGQNVRCYDDLLLDLVQALSGPSGIKLAANLRQRFKAALIDEFQDTDTLQWQIFRRMRGNDSSYPLFLIGDPKQAIYSFRGADIYAYLAAAETVQQGLRWTLKNNRRSVRLLVEAVNTLFGDCPDPFLSNGIQFQEVDHKRPAEDQLLVKGIPDQKPLQLMVYPNPEGKPPASGSVRQPIAAAVAAEISHLLAGEHLIREAGQERKLTPADLAVLVKTHAQAEQIQQALLALQIPSVQHGNSTIFETAEALDLLRILKAVAWPSNESLLKEALLGGLLGINANSLADMIASDDTRWEDWLICFFDLSKLYQSHGVVAMTTHLLEECKVRSRLLCLPDGERRLTNLMHCVELIHQAALENCSGIEGSIVWLERRLNRRQEDETALLRLETDADAVRIVTIHTSKGLQYPITFLPFAWDVPAKSPDRALFHQKDGHLVLDLGSQDLDEHLEQTRAEQDAEAIRLLYVALTRAEYRCYVVWGNIGQAAASPLRRFLHPALSKPFKEFGFNDILDDLSALKLKVPAIQVTEIASEEQPAAYRPEQDSTIILENRTFKKIIPNDWRVSSFSAIASGKERYLQPHDYDADSAGSLVSDRSGAAEGFSIFDFPRGAAAGTCLHELFEIINFADTNAVSIDHLIQPCLQRNGYDRQWVPAVQQMMTSVMNAQLIPAEPGFSLNSLKPGSWKCEMEFFLPLKRLSNVSLRELFAGLISPDVHGDFEDILGKLQLQETRGLLHGFMDMIFEHAGRYYIIDWKSNHLGYQYHAYHQNALQQSMAEHAYILQHHLYTLALDRFLRVSLPGYHYESHFGGAIYVFLRGVGSGNPDLGIYRDRPSIEFIRRSDKILLK
ncbi:MAG TPA: exodeoxyribonuclease V subunit beta [Desulfuromonadaceae bacterium]|jgi:exodeoxyribonuclease V beta subunit